MQGRVEFQLSSIHLLLGLKGKINGCHGRRMKAQEGRTDLHGWLPSSIFWKADILVIPHLLCSAHRFLRARNADLATSLSYLLWLLWTISLDTFFLSLSKKLKNVSISLSPSLSPLHILSPAPPSLAEMLLHKKLSVVGHPSPATNKVIGSPCQLAVCHWSP